MAAFGNYGQTNLNTPTVYGYALFNKESTIDKTMMSFSMWKTTLKIGIFPLIESDNDEVKYDKKNGTSIFLTPTKARIFSTILQNFKQDPVKFNNNGVPAGQSLITIVNSSEFNKPEAGPAIIIRKISAEGQVESSYAYEIKKNFHNAVVGFNEKTGKFDQDFTSYNDLEIDMIITQLEEYYKAMTNATAFTVIDGTYQTFDKIASKIGVDLNAGYNGGGGYNKSYFNNRSADTGNTAAAGAASYTPGSLENLMGA